MNGEFVIFLSESSMIVVSDMLLSHFNKSIEMALLNLCEGPCTLLWMA